MLMRRAALPGSPSDYGSQSDLFCNHLSLVGMVSVRYADEINTLADIAQVHLDRCITFLKGCPADNLALHVGNEQACVRLHCWQLNGEYAVVRVRHHLDVFKLIATTYYHTGCAIVAWV